MRVLTVVGTRPEVIKLSRVIARLDESTDHVLAHTGQNYDHQLNQVFFDELGIRRPDHFLDVADETLARTVANVIVRSDELIDAVEPDALLVLGDTNSALCVMSAKRRKVPIFHMEAGNRCFDLRVPEEINRRVIDHLSDVNLPYTEHARRYLLAEGLPADRIIKTGSPQAEVLAHHADAIDASTVLADLDLEPSGYLAVSLHREENVDGPEQLSSLVAALDAAAATFDVPVVFSTHPRTRARLDEAGITLGAHIRSLPPLGFADYVALQRDAFCTLSDSGTITEEAAIVGFCAVTVRETHERPEGMDEGVVVMTGLEPDRVVEGVGLARRIFDDRGPAPIPDDYRNPHVSWQVVNLITSYTPYVNRVVWSK